MCFYFLPALHLGAYQRLRQSQTNLIAELLAYRRNLNSECSSPSVKNHQIVFSVKVESNIF